MLIRTKLILRFTVLVVSIQVLLSVFIYYFNSTYRQQEFYSRLTGKARLTARLLIKRDLLKDSFFKTIQQGDFITLTDEQISIYDGNGQLLYTNATASVSPAHLRFIKTVSQEKPVRYAQGNVQSVGIAYPHAGRQYYVFASGFDEVGLAKQENLALVLLIGNVAAFAVIILAGWYFAGGALRPITQVIGQVDSITASNLNVRVDEGNQKDEIARLAMTFNRMLDRVQQAFESQKSFVSHASHELRTPLTNALGTLETSLTYDRDLPETKRSIASSVEEIKKIIELTNGLLGLAKAEISAFPKEPVRVDECLLEALVSVNAKYPSREINFKFGYLPPEEDVLTLPGNAQLLRTALFNIMDNACKYSEADVTVTLDYQTSGSLLITVTDSGIGITASDMKHIFEPLYRCENGKNRPGYGIGLAVTDKIVRLHGGHISVSSEVNRGTTFALRLPATPNLSLDSISISNFF